VHLVLFASSLNNIAKTRLLSDLDPRLAGAVSRYIESMRINAIRGAQEIGKNGERPEGKSESINIAQQLIRILH
jgi:hypothetical protein